MAIDTLKLEVWTRDESDAGTDGRIRCTLRFNNGLPPLTATLDPPGPFNFTRGTRHRFDIAVSDAHRSADPTDIARLDLENLTDNKWIPGAVGLTVNGAVILSRVLLAHLPPDVVRLPLFHDGRLEGMELRIRTADVPEAGTDDDDRIYCTISLEDGRQLASDLRLEEPGTHDLHPGDRRRYLIPLPQDPLWGATAADGITVAIRKDGSDGWLLGGVSLRANGRRMFDNDNVNQFLDNMAAVLHIRKWTSNRVLGPVLGAVGADSAMVQYRVERPGSYTLRVVDRDTGDVITTSRELAPTGVFQVDNLTPRRSYNCSLLSESGQRVGKTGTFTTFPPETEGARFAFAFGSCNRNRSDVLQRSWAQMRRLAYDPTLPYTAGAAPLRFFVHLGDSFYYYDDDVMKKGDVSSVSDPTAAARAAHLSSRLNMNFLDVARVLPMVAVWDDHDFRGDDLDSQGFTQRAQIRDEFLRYWGNADIGLKEFGLTTRITFGRTDLYVLDGRFRRAASGSSPAYFSREHCNQILGMIDARRAAFGPRLVGLASGSTWNGMLSTLFSGECYNDPVYATERAIFFRELRSRMNAGSIAGLFLLSGDIHLQEIYEVDLGGGRVAPEFVCSPLARPNSGEDSHPIDGERKFSRSVDDDDGLYAGFAVVTADTQAVVPNSNWTLQVDYYRHDDGARFFTHRYRLQDNEFRFA